MQTITDRDKRTLRIAGAGIAIYLVLFAGFAAWKSLEGSRGQYQQLVLEAQRTAKEIAPYENRILLLEKLSENFHMRPSKLSRSTLVADASAAIQKAAASGGLALGPMRESPARGAAKELAALQLEGMGPVAAVMTFLHRLESLGYPLIVENLQINGDATKPGGIKTSLTILILDFDQWKNEEARRV